MTQMSHETLPVDKMSSLMGFGFGALAGLALSMGLVGFVVGTSFGDGGRGGSVATPPAAPTNVPAPTAQPQPQGSTADLPPVNTRTDHVFGSPNAPVTIVEYTDFECPFCHRHYPVMRQLIAEYNGKVNWVQRHFPLSFHPNAQKAAEGSECVTELGGNDAYWKYAEYLFGLDRISPEDFPKAAAKAGVNAGKFKSCLDSGKYAKKVQDEQAAGMKAGVNGTPGNFVVKVATKEIKEVSGAQPASAFKAVIDPLLQ